MSDKDTIYRQAAIDAIHEDADWLAAQGSDWQVERMERDKSILKSLPPVQPERKKGKWIQNDNGTWSCDQCQSWIPDEQHYYARFCLCCGVKMERWG